ncbi:hypothetical protein PILCRDRAFT_824568 [Piloderma croceum F 1598]|uniref:Ubiquitin-like domain-containing protein n=1 Tax=Piloderma croceum (strain F 1598) TaxID=765440 RepID=A0A0C3FEG8_PILCF|nr:hypothetical protein PILCRDRAFT_824568 [Piloderma croceum F 1598]
MSDEDQQDIPPQPPTEEIPASASTEVKSESNSNTINVRVESSTGEEVFFKIKRNTKLSKLSGAYATKVGKDLGTFRFLYDGERITNEDTPDTLDMEDNDTIQVHVAQIGGSGSFLSPTTG